MCVWSISDGSSFGLLSIPPKQIDFMYVAVMPFKAVSCALCHFLIAHSGCASSFFDDMYFPAPYSIPNELLLPSAEQLDHLNHQFNVDL